ncbi:FAD-dependent oxidoreductase [Thermococcus thioreducens]|uniref:Glutamate synthase n=1 Tax=Thermococcus thioreducens TaxID=277988 RepID=A0A0Q2QR87_9EURY|nr:FAD-dependent oxidoreductase [Thermococcus thioreducens]ASJ12505.1 glutamate synthase [Thermococcus thioreducens]KQH82493.1 glutamate synthase [Thermococcus thioreducens]SEV89668.1 glutamate synthase (NADPH/NADH) small chain [Thermococcus thioreducens]
MRFYTCREAHEPKPFRVAVIGAGPAGLSAAGYLACRGYEVHVYDKMPEGGGMVAFAIPEARIPIRAVRDGVRALERLGVRFHFRTKVVYDSPREFGDEWAEHFVSLEKLLSEFDALLIATGAWRPRKLKVPGVELPGVYDALSLLHGIKMARIGYYSWERIPDLKGEHLVVIGAGYTAVDVAMEGRLLGAEKITMAYRRSLEHSYARAEIRKLIAEGVEFIEHATPVRILGEEKVEGVEFAKTKIVGGSVVTTDERFVLDADAVVYAIGQLPTSPIKEIVCASERVLEEAGIFFAGDVITPRNIGTAMREGRAAAERIEEWLLRKAPRRVFPVAMTGRLIAGVLSGKC